MMISLPDDPLYPGGIGAYGARLRRGETTARAATRAYLDRIALLDPRIGAYEHVAGDSALEVAAAMDALLAGGTDLGPLMGVPVAIKDIFAVEGMPTHAGSNADVTDLIGTEGEFVRRLKAAGCVVLGKLKTTEFALGGAGGINSVRGTPWNPWDAATHRVPGSSSSGSAAATAAGLCGFAIGSDTGGSVRGPAAFCGLFGLKTSVGLWPTDGVYPLSFTLDSVGLLCRGAADAAIAAAALSGWTAPRARPAGQIRLGRPTTVLFDDLEPGIAAATDDAMAALSRAGMEIVPFDLPELSETGGPGAAISFIEGLAALGPDRFDAIRGAMDPVVVDRLESVRDVGAGAYIDGLKWHRKLCRAAETAMRGLDGWIAPTRAITAPPVAAFTDLEAAQRINAVMVRNTRPANLFGLCASTSPIQGLELPAGLQLHCETGADRRLLEIALTMEQVIGVPAAPDVSGFLA